MVEKTDFESGTFYFGDCFEVMAGLEAGSVDMVLADLPYGTTSNAWDSVLPIERLNDEWRRCNYGAVVLTAAQPFTSLLVSKMIKSFWHNWTWIKPRPTGFQNAKKQPLRATEDVLVFGRSVYNPQGIVRIDKICKNSKSVGGGNVRDDISASAGRGSLRTGGKEYVQEFTNYPKNVLSFGLDEKIKSHPTQKPVALFEYLIRTYTNEGQLVLDNTAGSGTTAIAAMNAGRRWICIEKDETYYRAAVERVRKHEEMMREVA